MTEVEGIEEHLKEQRLRWLGHVERMDNERGPAKQLQLTLEGSKQGRPKKRWKELVEKDMVDRGLKKTDAKDRLLWKSGYKNRLTPACRDNLPCYRMSKRRILNSCAK